MIDSRSRVEEIRQVEDLAQIAREINGEHAAFESTFAKGIEHVRKTGELLLKAKRLVGRGNWLIWLARNCKFNKSTAKRYMMIAKRWDELKDRPGGLTASEAIRILSLDPPDEDEIDRRHPEPRPDVEAKREPRDVEEHPARTNGNAPFVSIRADGIVTKVSIMADDHIELIVADIDLVLSRKDAVILQKQLAAVLGVQ